MLVLNACQSLGLGVCPLNPAVTNMTELKICMTGKIPKGERLIMMIAFGLLGPTGLVIARSERMDVHDLLINH